MLRKYAFFLLALTVQVYFAQSTEQEKDDPTRWTPEDIIHTESLSSAAFSPDGSMVIWSKRKPIKKEDKFVSDLYLTRLNVTKDGKLHTTQLTSGKENNYNAVFSEDGETIYFRSSRDKGKKLWKLSIYGGEAQEVHEFENGISSITLRKGKIYFESKDGKTLYDAQAEEKKDDVIVVEDSLHWQPSHVYTFGISDKKIIRITGNEKPIGSYSISHNDKWMVYSVQQSLSHPADAQRDPLMYLKNLETSEVTQILKELEFPIGGIQFTGDDSGFYFVSEYSSDPEWNGAGISELYFFDLQTMQPAKIDLDWDLGLGGGFTVVGEDVLVNLANKATNRLAYYRKNGASWKKSIVDLDEKNDHVDVEAVSKSGDHVLYSYSTASTLPQYFIADLKNGKIKYEQEFISLNEKLEKKSITKSEVVTWNGYNDDEVTGILYYPENYQEGKKYPLMLSIHGGPSSRDLDSWSERWSTYPNLLAQKGMFVLKPNYHGSSNHGLEYVEAIKGNYYEPEMEDITKGIDKLVAEGKVDPDELGTMGWSNGAILTTMLTLKYPDKFKVAAPGAGDVNWTSDYGTCQFGVSFDQSYFGGAPWDDSNGKPYNENYLIKSPIFEIEKIKTPTIIFHGSEDRAVPRDQGWEYYRGLQQVGQAPVKFLWFPGQPHGLQKITHQLRKMNEEIDWIEKYLLEKPSEENEAFKEDSPLAKILKLQKAAQHNGLYGIKKEDLLIPETVLLKKDSISLGRFEVTNAQFQAFQPEFTFNVGKENYPVVTDSASAKKYTVWLSEKTGETYRLPNAKEAKSLHEKARKNIKKAYVLNTWAGYELTLDDVQLLQEKLKDLELSLIKPAGSTEGIKIEDAMIYNLAGNVAEYAEDTVYGYSAYDFADPFDDKRVKSEYVGFRVVKE
ncbi:MAG: prolyl oligopeptidase family serine peptidase [Leeuwenhoekiella sp.]